MRLLSIDIENFLSIEKIHIDFNESGMLLIEGWNYDTNSANGAGKTSIVAAVCFLLFGKNPRALGSSVVRKGAKQATCSGVIVDKNDTFFLKRSKPGKLSVTKNNVEISEEEFLKNIVIDYDTFLIVQYFAQGLSQRFLDLSDTDRKDLFIKLTNSFDFSKAKESIDSEIKKTTNKINDLNLKESSLVSRIEAYEESQQDIDALIDNEKKLISAIENTVNEINKIQKVEKPDLSKYLDLKTKVQNQLDEIVQNKGTSQFLRNKLKQIENEKQPEDVCDGLCPACSESIDIVNGQFIRHDSSSFEEKKKSWGESIKNKKKEIVDNIKQLESSFYKEEELKNIIIKCQDKINEQRESYVRTESRISELRNFIKFKKQELESVKTSIENQSTISDNILKFKNILSNVLIEKENITNEMLVLQTASQILSPTGVQAYVLDSIIETFNDKVNSNLQLTWSDCRYELKSHKENKSGSVVAKMSDNLTINGSTTDIGALSGGERKCLALSIDLALLDTYMSYSSLDLSPIILDEPFDHLDSVNRLRVFELLQESSKSKQIIVIDHSSEFKTLFDNIITINKKNEISTLL